VYRFQKVLVAIDWWKSGPEERYGLSVADYEAVQTAMMLSSQHGAELTFVSILDQAEPGLGDVTEDVLDDRARPRLDKTLIALADRAEEQQIAARACVCYGTAWLELVREVLREEYDLVVLGHRESAGSPQTALGNTALKLLRNAPCAVWVTRPRSDPEDFFVLTPSDLSERSADLLHLVVALGQMTDSKTRLLHAVDRIDQDAIPTETISDEDGQTLQSKAHDAAEETLFEHLATTDHRTLTYGVLTHVVEGPADAAILKAIDEFTIDLLVMETGSAAGVPGQWGSTAETVLPRVPCGILAIKPDGFESPVTVQDE